eukprot:scaffold5303_cov392-Prasinococcus_capsulatus_cf.AAC.1
MFNARPTTPISQPRTARSPGASRMGPTVGSGVLCYSRAGGAVSRPGSALRARSDPSLRFMEAETGASPITWTRGPFLDAICIVSCTPSMRRSSYVANTSCSDVRCTPHTSYNGATRPGQVP